MSFGQENTPSAARAVHISLAETHQTFKSTLSMNERLSGRLGLMEHTILANRLSSRDTI